MIEVWRGSAQAWDCDEMGHLNVRHYIAIAWEGVAVFAHDVGLAHAFRVHQGGTLLPRRQHVRFVREVRAGEPIVLTAAVVESDAEAGSFLLYQELRHSVSGEIAASFRTEIAHVDRWSERQFSLSPFHAARLGQVGLDPGHAVVAARGLDAAKSPSDIADITQAQADACDVPVIGRGRFGSHDADVNGRIRPDAFIGRISESVPNLMHGWRVEVGQAVGIGEAGAAVLEFNLAYRRWPKAGDLWHLQSSLSEAGPKTHTLVHWVMDPVSGQPWLTAEALAVVFDRGARKVVEVPAEQLQALEASAPRGLNF